MIGYMIGQALRNRLLPGGELATLLTQVCVDPGDSAFDAPDKLIGQVYDQAEAVRLAAVRGWQVAPDATGWRRVVASPMPLEILQQPVVAILLDAGVTIICTGGGGSPCARQADGGMTGIEAVVDKDRASALLAIGLAADAFFLLTDVDVDAAYVDSGATQARSVSRTDTQSLLEKQDPIFGPAQWDRRYKAPSALSCHSSPIGRLEDACALLGGSAGTIIDTLFDWMSFQN